MGKPGNKNQSKISNIYGRIPGANDISKDRYTDPVVPGVGSPYDQTMFENIVKKGEKLYEKGKEVVGKVKDYFTDKPSEDGWTYPKSNSWGTGGWQQRHKGDSTQTRNLYSNKGWRNPDGSYANPEEKNN